MRFLIGLAAFTLVIAPMASFASSILVESPDKSTIYIAYPKEGSKISADSTFIVGASNPDSALTINGAPVRKNAQGFFAHVVKLKRGTNAFTATLADRKIEKTLHVVRPELPAALAATGATIAADTVEPRVDTGLSFGDLLILKARATPGGTVTVKIDNRTITLSPAPEVRQSRQAKKAGRKGAAAKSAAPSVNEGLAHAYGKVFQSLPANSDDLYVGFYKIQPDDRFSSSKIKFTLKKEDGKTATAYAPGAVTVLTQPHIVQTVHDDTIVRVSPDKARLTPLPQGVRLTVDGWQGDNVRCLYGPGQHVFLKSADVAHERGSGPPAKSFISTINISRSTYGDAVVLPLNQRLPFHIEQSLNPNKLVVKVYGGTSDTDYASQQYRRAFEEGQEKEDVPQSGSISRNPNESGLIDGVTWRQVSDDVYEATVRIRGQRQWGFAGTYQGNNLVVHVKNPAPVQPSGQQSLAGLSICVDPGHGSPAPGSTGCSGVTEAQLNLAISQRLRKILEAEGARVTMTRTTDNDVDLYERCAIARNNGADVLLSVHNNSLPDGRDPWKEHGSSTYWYHPQATELARVLKDALVRDIGFPDIGARYQNLALTRASNQLSVLVEVGFMINPDEYAQMLKPEVQDRIAQSLAGGLKKYFAESRAK